jgi:hypothetical protein
MLCQYERIVTYSVYVACNDFVDFQRVIDLRLESGGTATIAFLKNPPNDWLQFREPLKYSPGGMVSG